MQNVQASQSPKTMPLDKKNIVKVCFDLSIRLSATFKGPKVIVTNDQEALSKQLEFARQKSR